MNTQLPLPLPNLSLFNKKTSSTFADNTSLPVHRWFRYSAGFSALWVRELVRREAAHGRARLLDPFAGSGTAVLEGEYCGLEAVGLEAHPFVARIAQAKLHWREPAELFRQHALSVSRRAREIHGSIEYPKLVRKCFPDQPLSHLDALRQAWEATSDNSAASELTWVALTSILRACSPVGTAQWQYILPKKSKARVLEPYDAFQEKVELMAYDMALRQRGAVGPRGRIHWDDARQCVSVRDGWADLVITSPPYANNYDYADATRLEMTFWGEITRWADLQDTVRKHLVVSCTQHARKTRSPIQDVLNDSLLDAIQEEIAEVCERLAAERELHGGKKPYHTMIAAYFRDMASTWVALRRVTKQGALVCFVVGDSAPYGVYVPVDVWLGELALAAGFRSYSFEKTRDRNVKWKNRKHRVPLKEGRLWIGG